MNSEVNRIVDRLNILGGISDDDKCLSRFFGTEAHRTAANSIKEWMEMAGMEVFKDDLGNVRGIIKSEAKNAKHFVIGSHYDTVFDAGKYDGPLGILLGIEVADRISKTKTKLPFHLNVVAFSDEEGSRFNTAYLGSSALAGNFDHEWLNREDDEGFKVSTVLQQNDFIISNIKHACIRKQEWLGYFEAHIEQGPVLCDENLSVCLVSGIAAQTRLNVQWVGISGHAGTCPMTLRNDALCAASEFVLEVENIGRENSQNLVATVGKLSVKPNSSNVIPGLVMHSIDLRSSDEELLESVVGNLYKTAIRISTKRKLKCEWDVMQSNSSVLCDEQLKKTLAGSISSNVNRLIEIPSGAGHDAVMISKVAPVSMLFIRCKDGISHNPLEYASPEDIEDSLNVCNSFIEDLAKIHRTIA